MCGGCVVNVHVVMVGRAPRSVTMRVRLDYLDHTLAQPGLLDNSGLSKVPVIRVFGTSSFGSRCCLHIHQVYPYFYIDYLGSLNPDNGPRIYPFFLTCQTDFYLS